GSICTIGSVCSTRAPGSIFQISSQPRRAARTNCCLTAYPLSRNSPVCGYISPVSAMAKDRNEIDRCIKAHVVIAVIASSALNEIFDAGATEFAETFDESRRQNFDITGPAVMVQRPQYLDVMSLCGAHARVDMREVEM